MSMNIISNDNKTLSIEKKYIEKYPDSFLYILSSMENSDVTNINMWSSDVIEMILNFYKNDELLVDCDKRVSTTTISLIIGYFLLPDNLKVRFYSSEENLDYEYEEYDKNDKYSEEYEEEDYDIFYNDKLEKSSSDF